MNVLLRRHWRGSERETKRNGKTHGDASSKGSRGGPGVACFDRTDAGSRRVLSGVPRL